MAENMDDVLVVEETFSEEDFDGGNFKPPTVGEHIFKIVKVEGKVNNKGEFPKPGASIELHVEDPNDPCNDARAYDYVGLPWSGEHEKVKARRALILSRLGFISKNDASSALKFNWKKLEGLRVIAEVEHNEWEDDKGKKRMTGKVTFGGYIGLADGNGETAPAENADGNKPNWDNI